MKWSYSGEYQPKKGEIIEYNVLTPMEPYNSIGRVIKIQESPFGAAVTIYTFNIKTYRYLYDFKWRRISENKMMAYL